MAGWPCFLVIFLTVLVSAPAFPSQNVKGHQQIAQNKEGRPLEMKVDTNDAEFQAIVALAIQEFSKKSAFIYDIVQYLTVDVKVFEGVLYVFDIVLGKTNCPVINRGKPDENCQIIRAEGQSEFYLCHFIVWKCPYSEKKKILLSNCKILDL
ncbi:cystatin-like [Hemiscyllium ocellatum]|uniref:cystatin-like n=1 Tax=Hemiscyllium ocellatum TaxID=170820 RepID=UPI0029661952|nr:cystatin-like [Hemiscyllium ocellatum]